MQTKRAGSPVHTFLICMHALVSIGLRLSQGSQHMHQDWIWVLSYAMNEAMYAHTHFRRPAGI